MKKILVLFCILFVSSKLMAQDDATKFIKYTTSSFSIQLPDTLQYGKLDIQSNKVTLPAGVVGTSAWTMMVKGTIYSISIADYPESVVKQRAASDFLTEGKQGLVNQLGGELVTEKAVTLNNHPGVRYNVKSIAGSVDALHFFVGTKLYTLLVLYNPSSYSGKDVNTFLDSFRLN